MFKRKPLVLAAAMSVLAVAALMARPSSSSEDTGRTERVTSVCATKDLALRGEPHRLQALCTRAARDTSPNDAGRIDLYLLKQEAEGWRPVAQRLGIESGRMGQPGEVTVLQLGPAFYGFELSETSVSQGYLLGSTRVYVAGGEGFHAALDFTSSVKNTGSHECADSTPAVCSDFSRRLAVQPQEGAAVHALRITSMGTFRGQPVSASHVLPYDPKRQQYRLPAGFEAHVE